MSRIKAVWFHSAIPIPGLGEFTQVGDIKTPGVRLELTDLGLNLNRGGIRAFIPIVNIKSVLFDSPELEAVDAQKPKVRLG